MGLFSKKPPCPICGGKISWLLPTKIEGEYICDDCAGKIDLPDEVRQGLTMDAFRQYLTFYESNCLLREKFFISARMDFGLWDTKLIFDYENRLFCMSKLPDKTVFEGAQLKSFTIYEDSKPLYTGDAQTLRYIPSSVPDQAMAMAPQITQFVLNRQMMEAIEHLDDDDDNHHHHRNTYFDIPEPFRAFNVELRLDHPYWPIIRADMDGPRFSSTHPDVNDYLHEYRADLDQLAGLVYALKTVAFPNAVEVTGNKAAPAVSPEPAPVPTAAPPADTITEIKRFKELLDGGIISEEEFAAKKKQLLSI